MSRSAASPFCTETLRAAFGRFATGVAYVENDHDGLIVSSFAAVSLEPPLVSFCPSLESRRWSRMRAAGAFRVHVLGEHHATFARRPHELLREPLAVFACDLFAEHPAGDHTIVVGRVRGLRLAGEPRPLVYFAGAFHKIKENQP
jgi:3-hydroxy-9,10-secoandrosta-1,3,5(10)-triene-9,17-dione monooxygenase reductase component